MTPDWICIPFLSLLIPVRKNRLHASWRLSLKKWDIIWETGLDNLDQETFSDVTSGEALEADIVAKCKFKGSDKYFLIHQENQAKSFADFPKRTFKYFARYYEKHDLDIYPIALFIFDAPLREEPDSLQISFPNLDVLNFKFRVIQLNRLNWRDYIRTSNPVAAALMSKMKFEKRDRPYVKLECLRLLATLKLNQVKSRFIANFVNAYLKLDAKEKLILSKEIETLELEEKEQMIQLTNEWIEEGERIGMEKGEKQGMEKEAQNLLFRLGRKQLGSPSELVTQQLNLIEDKERLESLCERIFDVSSWQDLLEN